MEVALKMALRAYSKRFGVDDKKKKNLGVLGLKGSYHGDTIGAMNACEAGEGVYTCEWHDSKGFWFDPPTISMRNSKAIIALPEAIACLVEADGSIDLVREAGRDGGKSGGIGVGLALAQAYDVETRVRTRLAKIYAEYIGGVLYKLNESGVELAALVLEPLLMGAGGMIFVDPLFQRVMVEVVRGRQQQDPAPSPGGEDTWKGMPVVFDEVFVGMYRLGHLSASSVIGTHPDISVHAKMLTGGLVPLAVTLAKEGIFNAFLGDRKDQALLHGHSYTAYPIGCEVANETLRQMDKLVGGQEWNRAQTTWGNANMKKAVGIKEERARNIWSFWDPSFVDKLSGLEAVVDTMAMGTVLVIKVNDASRGKLIRCTSARWIFS
jgi:dethiobiotin synthetase/adenosylmethionine--8-amino-7-oxononanoate aminotransferase